MTLEKQVHMQEMEIFKLKQRINQLELLSHEPVDFIERIKQALYNGEISLAAGKTGKVYRQA